MQKLVAKNIIDAAVDLDRGIGRLYDEIALVSDRSERQALSHAVDEIMKLVARDIIFPLTAIYPDLDPDQK